MKTKENILTAQDLLEAIKTAELCGKDLETITIDLSYFRCLTYLRGIAEDLYDEGNKKIESIVLIESEDYTGEVWAGKPLTAKVVLKFLEHVSINKVAYGGTLSDVTVNYRANFDEEVYPFTNGSANIDLKAKSISLLMCNEEYISDIRGDEKQWDLMYDKVDQCMIEGDEAAKEIIEKKGYSASHYDLWYFLNNR